MNIPLQVALWAGLLKDFFAIAAAITGIYVGLRGLQTWRRQMRGQSEHTVARAILRGTYKWRDAIETARHPWISAGEMMLSGEERNTAPERAQYFGVMKAYDNRWAAVMSARTQLQVDLFDARALWGDSLLPMVEKLERLSRELHNAINRHLRMQDTTQARDSIEAVRQVHAARRNVLNTPWGNEEEDPFGEDFNAVVTEIERYLRPKI